MGNLDRDKVEVEVYDLKPFSNNEFRGVAIQWDSDIGFGEYNIYQSAEEPNKWYADSECMDTTEDKWFLRKLLDNFIDQLEITG